MVTENVLTRENVGTEPNLGVPYHDAPRTSKPPAPSMVKAREIDIHGLLLFLLRDRRIDRWEWGSLFFFYADRRIDRQERG